MIEQVYVVRFGCLRDLSVRLSPFHALIGPNDSGKSTFLCALESAVSVASRPAPQPRSNKGLERFLAARQETPLVGVVTMGGSTYTLATEAKVVSEKFSLANGASKCEAPFASMAERGILDRAGRDPDVRAAADQLRGVRLLRLDPDAMRESSALLPEGSFIGFVDERGRGLPGVYDAIVNRGDDSFRKIADDVRALFPTVKNLRLKTVSSSTKVIEVELTDGKKVAANEMSEGLLYYLGFAAIPYLESTSLLLVEEPENGLHPSRIADVVRALRAISEKGTQVVMATHSPLVINEMRPDEVTVFTRSEQGTVATPIADTPRFAERSKVYALGELWLAYANGKDEAPLLSGEGTPA